MAAIVVPCSASLITEKFTVGKILGQLDSYSLELGKQSLYEIEGAVEDWRQKVLPGMTAELLHNAQTQFTQDSKKQ